SRAAATLHTPRRAVPLRRAATSSRARRCRTGRTRGTAPWPLERRATPAGSGSARSTSAAPHRLKLVAFEELGQLVLLLRDDAGQRHGEVVAQCEIAFAGVLVLAALE